MKILFTIFVVVAMGLQSVQACSCAAREFVAASALQEYDAVFMGKCVSIAGEKEMKGVTVVLEVQRAWKGEGVAAGKRITVTTPPGGGMCGFPFEQGKCYIVYGSGKPISTNLCTFTKLAGAPDAIDPKAAEEMKQLDGAKAGG